jgi:uncharacterized membrane protein
MAALPELTGIGRNQHRNRAMIRYMTVGLSVLAGVALFEVALVPAIAIGGAALLAPKLVPGLRRRTAPATSGTAPPPVVAAAVPKPAAAPPPSPQSPQLAVKIALAKTVSYRIIVTALDFTTNLVVTGSVTVAAGLSTLTLTVGPIVYFAHETAWNYLNPSGAAVALMPGFAISRRIAKTITFRIIATASDFTANFVGTGDLASAAVLTAFGFVVGPFVYLGHEMLWDYFTTRESNRLEPQPAPISVPAIAPAAAVPA